VLLQNWYDANSRRIAKQEFVGGVTKKWLYLYDGWDIVGVMNESGVLQETFTRGVGLAGDIGTLVAVTHHTGPSAGTYYTHHNHRGDIVLVRTGTTTTATYGYSAFGKLATSTGTDLCRFKFSSKERETTCGLSYYGYRFYAPEWQRWLNRDPIGEKGGLNLYSPLNNDPGNTLDGMGLSAACDAVFEECMKQVNDDCETQSRMLENFYDLYKDTANRLNEECKSRCPSGRGFLRNNCIFACDLVFGKAAKAAHVPYVIAHGTIQVLRGAGIQACENARANCILDELRRPGDPVFHIPMRPF